MRMVVESIAGPDQAQPLSNYPERFRITENTAQRFDANAIPCHMPEKDKTDVLVDSYFTNVRDPRV